MKFFNLQYKNNFKQIIKSSNRNLYFKYNYFIKKRNLRKVNNNININNEFINYISINKKKTINMKMYKKDYYIKNNKYNKQVRFKLSNNEKKNRKLYSYYMTKDIKTKVKQKKKKSLDLKWDFCNPCEK